MNIDNLLYHSEELGMVFKIDANEQLFVAPNMGLITPSSHHFEPVDFYDLRDAWEGDSEVVTIIEDIHFGLILAKRAYD